MNYLSESIGKPMEEWINLAKKYDDINQGQLEKKKRNMMYYWLIQVIQHCAPTSNKHA